MRRTLLHALLALALAAPGLLACGRLPESVTVIDEAELWQGVSETFPAGGRFEPVSLRDHWGLVRRRAGVEGWYRAHFEAGPTLEGVRAPQAVLVETLYPNGEVFLNGVSLGSGGRMTPPPARNRFRPVYLTFPGTLLQTGRNELWIRFVGTPGSIGGVSPVYVGPVAALWPVQQWMNLAGVEAVRVGLALALLLAALMAVSAVTGGAPPGSAWFAGGLLTFAVSGMSVFTADLAIPSRAVEWTATCATHATALLFAIGVGRSLGDDRRGAGRWIGLYVAIGLVGLWIPALYIPMLWVLWWIPSGILCLRMLFRMGRRVALHGELRWAPALLLVVVALSAPMVANLVPISRFSAAISPLVLVLVVGTHLFLQLRDAQRGTELLNRELEDRVAARETELAENYARLGELERERTVVAERQRITRDMHDGVGGHLVSALSQVRSNAGNPDNLERTLEEALFDLRLTIDSFQPGAADLPALLGGMRASLARRVELAGMTLQWRISDAGEGRALSPDALLHVIRFVQEAVTNAVRHSGGRSVTVETGEAGQDLALSISDDGSGGVAERDPAARADVHSADTADQQGGSGLRHMRERAALLGHPLEVASSPAGTRLTLRISPQAAEAGPG